MNALIDTPNPGKKKGTNEPANNEVVEGTNSNPPNDKIPSRTDGRNAPTANHNPNHNSKHTHTQTTELKKA